MFIPSHPGGAGASAAGTRLLEWCNGWLMGPGGKAGTRAQQAGRQAHRPAGTQKDSAAHLCRAAEMLSTVTEVKGVASPSLPMQAATCSRGRRNSDMPSAHASSSVADMGGWQPLLPGVASSRSHRSTPPAPGSTRQVTHQHLPQEQCCASIPIPSPVYISPSTHTCPSLSSPSSQHPPCS